MIRSGSIILVSLLVSGPAFGQDARDALSDGSRSEAPQWPQGSAR